MTLFAAEKPALPLIECGRCGQPLTRKRSRERGFGDDCAEILGMPVEPRVGRVRNGGDCDGQGDLLEEW